MSLKNADDVLISDNIARSSMDVEEDENALLARLACEPHDHALLDQLVNLLTYHISDLQAARTQYDLVLAADPDNSQVRVKYAWFLAVHERDLRHAHAQYAYIIAHSTQEQVRQHFQRYIDFLVDIGMRDTARGFLTDCIAMMPAFPGHHISYARLLNDEYGQFDAGKDVFQRYIDGPATQPDARFHLAYAKYLSTRTQDDTEARAQYSHCMRLEPANYPNRREYIKFLVQDARDLPVAQEQYRQAMLASPTDTRIKLDYALFLANILHDNQAAIELYTDISNTHPTDVLCMVQFAQHIADSGDDPAKGLQVLLVTPPTTAEDMCTRADVMARKLGDLETSRAMFELALEMDAVNYKLRLLFMACLVDCWHEPSTARSLGEEYLLLNPYMVSFRLEYAKILDTMGNQSAAVEQYNVTMMLQPTNVTARQAFIDYLIKHSNIDAAKGHYDVALLLNPTHDLTRARYALFLAHHYQDLGAARRLYDGCGHSHAACIANIYFALLFFFFIDDKARARRHLFYVCDCFLCQPYADIAGYLLRYAGRPQHMRDAIGSIDVKPEFAELKSMVLALVTRGPLF